ncbi:172a22c8-c1e6-4064-a58b-dd44fad90395 [Sclerotinia trifoliorum]|uniref:172a22c8-c1e6-4064-a58b-dd44fad90395 n=1 Tax=Sclerotinia trifoliorum TaxID=28548 RepID=A0A8H2VUI8_9HELO|nr:172a22c8-c1e6-4064-a58b-dd44fad90395 [Sclerotinia trifoliorum]
MNNSYDGRSGVDRHPSTPNLLALSRDEYISRVENATATDILAISEEPPVEIEYPDWTIRYASLGGSTEVTNIACLYDGFMAGILKDPALNIDDTSNWTSYNFYTKSVANRQNNRGPAAVGPVASTIVSAKAATIIITLSNPEAEVGRYIPRLYASELMYQSWRDTCNEDDSIEAGYQVSNLKYIIRGPIVDQGIHDTIRDVLEATGFSSKEIDRGVRTTFSVTDVNPALLRRLMETEVGRSVARMCTDHPQSLGAKQVGKIHVWNDVLGSDADGVLVFELE